MIYPINIKKKIKESRRLKENVRSVASVAAWLKDSIAAMTANQELTISRRILDSNFGFYVYWTQGFDINDDSVIHADADKSYGLVAALKCRNDAEWDGEYMDSPYDPETGDLYCEDYELSPKDNTEMVAEWLLEDYDSMVELMNNNPGTVIGGLKESKSIKEAPDADGILYDYEVGAKYNDMANAEMKQNAEYRKQIAEYKSQISKLVPEIKEMLNKIRSANKTYLTVNAGKVFRGTFEVEGDFNIDSKYKVNKIPEGSSYLTIKHNDSGERASRYSASVTDNGEIYTWADTGSWTDFALRDKGYATSKALKFFLDNFDAVKARFKIDLAPKEYIYKYDGKFLDSKLAEQGYDPENEEDDDYIWDYKRDRQFVNNKTVKLISDKPDEDGMVDIEYGYNQKLAVYFSELTPINESKSIKEGLTAREILDQAKALLEK